MAENLKTTRFKDGTAIPSSTDNTSWINLTTPVYCWYDNNPTSNKELYGGLYNWNAVKTGNLCPSGWHVPTDEEWTILTDYLGGISVAGGKLKEAGNAHWLEPNVGATNETGFTALPGGCRYITGVFDCVGSHCYWWSSSPYTLTSNAAFLRAITWDSNGVEPSTADLNFGCSIRCVKD
jgi:uncharacterized protein (TIGR02145 family)